MPTFNFVAGEILFRIVFFGALFCGKGAILRELHARIDTPSISPIRTRQPGADPLLAFDFLPSNPPAGLPAQPRIELITMPEAPANSAATTQALTGADGLVFVVDTRWEKIEDSVQSLDALAATLRNTGTPLDEMPLAVLYNNRTLPGIAPLDYLEYVINGRGPLWPAFEAGAPSTPGAISALNALLKIILAKHTASSGHS
jgi:hypothetical protein